MRGQRQTEGIKRKRPGARPQGVKGQDSALRPAPRCRAPEQGSISVVVVAALPVILGFCALALDLAFVYNRKAELQTMVDSAALAAARQLNGTPAGVTNAIREAADRLENSTDGVTYKYGAARATWNNSAIRFGSTPSGPWVDAGSASGDPRGLSFVRVNTDGLGDSNVTDVPTFLAGVVSEGMSALQVSAQAIAGPYSINVVPLGICALSANPTDAKGAELVEYGFRRGVSYDLMKLDPDPAHVGPTGQSFLIDPVAPPGTAGTAAELQDEFVKPFVCSGTMAMPLVTQGAITVRRPFPIDALFAQLNSRFGIYSPPCNSVTAPPDANTKAFVYNGTYGSYTSWMSPTPAAQSAALVPGAGPMYTIADAPSLPAGTGAAAYGPLWLYAKAVPFSAAGSAEPAGGYTVFGTADWSSLYPVTTGSPPAAGANYPATTGKTTPYLASSGAFFAPPPAGGPGIRNRRVLNVPLLSCPVSGSSATAVAVAKFFMTVPATSSSLYAEFAGIAPEFSLSANVELYR